MTLVGTVVIPGVAVGFLLVLPFLDRRRGRGRPPARLMGGMLLLFLGAGGLTAVAMRSDANDPAYQEGRREADLQAALAVELALEGGIDSAGRIVLYEGYRLFHDKGCASCHALESEHPSPLLSGYGSVARVKAFLTTPDTGSISSSDPTPATAISISFRGINRR